MIFFVLSGFFVGGSVLNRGPKFSFRDYILARLSRLWIVLLPAIALTFITDRIISAWVPSVLTGSFRAIWHSGPFTNGPYSSSMGTLLGNLCFLQTIHCSVFGSNIPAWSLANEWWYYLLFPCLAITAGWVGRQLPKRRIAGAVIALAIVMFIPGSFYVGFGIWCLGVLLYVLAKHLPNPGHWPPTVAAAGFVGVLYGVKLLPSSPVWLTDLIVGVAFFILAVSLVKLPAPGVMLSKISLGLSEVSYSLYLSHFPLVLLVGIYWRSGKISPDGRGLLLFAAYLAGLFAFAVVFWLCFERHTHKLRGWLTSAARQLRLVGAE
jgi:peptidoglycan/LPS O-acetylase OafA/YrhL